MKKSLEPGDQHQIRIRGNFELEHYAPASRSDVHMYKLILNSKLTHLNTLMYFFAAVYAGRCEGISEEELQYQEITQN